MFDPSIDYEKQAHARMEALVSQAEGLLKRTKKFIEPAAERDLFRTQQEVGETRDAEDLITDINRFLEEC